MRDDENGVPNGRRVPNGHARNGVPTNGHRLGPARPPAFTRVLAVEDEADLPTDLVAVQADDELCTALGTRSALGRPPTPLDRPRPGRGPAGSADDGATTDDRLVAMLAAWRAEIDAEPIPELVDLDTAVAAVMAGIEAQGLATRRRRSGRLRQLAPLAAAAAVIVATVTGVGIGSQDAMPGDTLWAIQKVVNPERAESVEAKVAVEGHLAKARTALQTGDTTAAAQELQAATTQISSVRGQEGQPQLVQEQQFLSAKLVDTPPGTKADLSTPPKSNPALRPTGAPVPPPPAASTAPEPATAPSSTGPESSGSEYSGSQSSGSQSSGSQSTGPQSTGPEVNGPAPDRSSAAIVAPKPGEPGPPPPAHELPPPPVTSVPEATPPPHPEPPGGPGKVEGGPDPRDLPKPDPGPGPVQVDPAPPTEGVTGAKPDDNAPPPSSDNTSASGSAGASVEATATDTTT